MKKEKPPTPAKAFTRSGAGYEFAGKVLPHKFSAFRQAAALCMGLRYGNVDPDDIITAKVMVDIPTTKGKKARRQEIEFQTYAQQFSDVVFVMWLCSVPDSRVQRAERKPSEARGDAFKWAEEQGLGIATQRYYDAVGTFYRMMDDITASTAVPAKATDGEEEDDNDPNE